MLPKRDVLGGNRDDPNQLDVNPIDAKLIK